MMEKSSVFPPNRSGQGRLRLGSTGRQGFLSHSILCMLGPFPSGAEAGDGGIEGAAGDLRRR
jgi:hypothetical protein